MKTIIKIIIVFVVILILGGCRYNYIIIMPDNKAEKPKLKNELPDYLIRKLDRWGYEKTLR